MVRLKENPVYTSAVTAGVFQFHYGTIKSGKLGEAVYYRAGFQFHYGTIKSQPAAARSSSCCYFNSTMVRLKVKLNSIMKK